MDFKEKFSRTFGVLILDFLRFVLKDTESFLSNFLQGPIELQLRLFLFIYFQDKHSYKRGPENLYFLKDFKVS